MTQSHKFINKFIKKNDIIKCEGLGKTNDIYGSCRPLFSAVNFISFFGSNGFNLIPDRESSAIFGTF